jgi:hypothetical protein
MNKIYDSAPRTTAMSMAEGRMKEGLMKKTRKNVLLKKLINDGRGGCGKKK